MRLKFWILELKPYWVKVSLSCFPKAKNWTFVLTTLVGFTFRKGQLRRILFSIITKFFTWVKRRPQ